MRDISTSPYRGTRNVIGSQLIDTDNVHEAMWLERIEFLEPLAPFYAEACSKANEDLFIDSFYPVYLKRSSDISSTDKGELQKEVRSL